MWWRLKSHSQCRPESWEIQIAELNADRSRLKKSWSDLRKGNVTNDNLSASGVKRECTERMKSALWQRFGGNRDAPLPPLRLHPATHNHVKCETYLSNFLLPSRRTHISRSDTKYLQFFWGPIKRWKKSQNKTEWHGWTKKQSKYICGGAMQEIRQISTFRPRKKIPKKSNEDVH